MNQCTSDSHSWCKTWDCWLSPLAGQSCETICTESLTRKSPDHKNPIPPLIVALDLDGTLIHAHRHSDWPYDFSCGQCDNIYVSRRPGVFEFLKWIRQPKFKVVVFTAGSADYAHLILADLDPTGQIVQEVLSRAACLPSPKRDIFIKDLRKLTACMNRVVLVDNTPLAFLLQPDNGILVKDWRSGHVNDTELARVRRILERLVDVSDVREALRHDTELESISELLIQSANDLAQCTKCGVVALAARGRMITNQNGKHWFCVTCSKSITGSEAPLPEALPPKTLPPEPLPPETSEEH